MSIIIFGAHDADCPVYQKILEEGPMWLQGK